MVISIIFFTKRKEFHGEVFALYLLGYGLGRVWIEGLRTDQLKLPGTELAVSQLLSAVLAVAALVFILIKRKNKKGNKK